MSNIAFIGLPRYSLGSLASGAPSPATMPLSRLTDWMAWSKTRLLSADPALTYVEAVPTMPLGYYGPTPQVGGIAWANHSLGLGATARSMALGAGAAGYLPERVAPNGLTINVGSWTGAVGDIDESPHSPDASNLRLNDANGNILIDFATPSATPRVGSDLQAFRIVISYVDHPNALVFQLFEGGVFRRTLEVTLPEGGDPEIAAGQVYFIRWDAGDLTTASGANVQLAIALNQTVGDDFAVEAVDWLCEPNLTSGSILYDTGWLPATMDQYDATWGATVSGTVGVAPQQTLVHVFSENVPNVAKVVTQFRDPLNSVGYIDLGEMVVGPQFVPTYNRDWGSLVKLIGRDTITELESGADAVVRREPKRQMNVPMTWLTNSEAYSLLERIWRAGAAVPFAVATVPDDVTESTHTALYVRCTGMPDLAARPGNLAFRSMSIELTEAP